MTASSGQFMLTEGSDGYLRCSSSSIEYDGTEDDCILGQGTYGIVKRVNIGSYHFALKLAKANHEKELKTEMAILQQLDHKNIVAIKYVLSDAVGYLMELVEGGTLYELIYDKNRPLYTIDYVIQWAYQIATAVAYMHQNGFIHCDLKPSNFLMKPGYKVIKLSDFGSTIKIKRIVKMPIGTAPYQAPEAPNCSSPDGRIDVYSFGISFWEAAEKKKPRISPDGPGPFILTTNKQFIKLLKSCFNLDAGRRPLMEEVVRKLDSLSSKYNNCKQELKRLDSESDEPFERQLHQALAEKHKIIMQLKLLEEVNRLRIVKLGYQRLIQKSKKTLEQISSNTSKMNPNCMSNSTHISHSFSCRQESIGERMHSGMPGISNGAECQQWLYYSDSYGRNYTTEHS